MDLYLQDKAVGFVWRSIGIGLAAARGFLNEGSKVAVISRMLDSIEHLNSREAKNFATTCRRTSWIGSSKGI